MTPRPASRDLMNPITPAELTVSLNTESSRHRNYSKWSNILNGAFSNNYISLKLSNLLTVLEDHILSDGGTPEEE